MMARFSAGQTVLQSVQSLTLAPHEGVCKSKEILVIFRTGRLLRVQTCRASTAEGYFTTAGWSCCSLFGLLPEPADLPHCQEEKLDALLRGLYLFQFKNKTYPVSARNMCKPVKHTLQNLTTIIYFY